MLFEDLAVEINALAEIHPDELRRATENAIAPFVDPELQSRLNDAKQRAEDRLREELEALYAEAKPGLRDSQEAIPAAFDEYNEELADEREALNEKIREVNEAIHEGRANVTISNTLDDPLTLHLRYWFGGSERFHEVPLSAGEVYDLTFQAEQYEYIVYSATLTEGTTVLINENEEWEVRPAAC